MSRSLLIKLLQGEYNEICQKVCVSEKPYSFLTERTDDGSPHIEISGNEYHLVVTERGLELSRQTTKSKDELLYWLISQAALGMSVSFEFSNRVEKQDSRRLIFARQIELLGKANPLWADRRQNEINEILRENPYLDDVR